MYGRRAHGGWNGEEAKHAGGDRRQAAAGRGPDRPRQAGRRADPGDWGLESTYYRWRAGYGGLKLDQVRQIKLLEQKIDYMESFNGKFCDELVACEAFNTPAEAKVLIEQWRKHYSTLRPHSSLSYWPPAREVVLSRTSVLAPPLGPAGSAAAFGNTLD